MSNQTICETKEKPSSPQFFVVQHYFAEKPYPLTRLMGNQLHLLFRSIMKRGRM